MNLASTILGGVIGAAIGVAAQMVFELTLSEASWFPIVIGLCTGVGVRKANGKANMLGANYLRGGVTGLLALGAIVGSAYLLQFAMPYKDDAPAAASVAVAEVSDEGEVESEPADLTDMGPVTPTVARADATDNRGGVATMSRRRKGVNAWQFVFLAVGALVAYEMGRGGQSPRTESANASPEPDSAEPGADQDES